MPSDRTPVLVGLGEVICRPDEGPAPDPSVLMAEATRRAAADAQSEALLQRLDVIAVAPSAGWPDGDPGRSVCQHLGAEARTLRSSMQGGNGPQLLLGALGSRIAAGEMDAAVVCGGEALYTAARAGGRPPHWAAADPGRAADEVLEGEAAPGTTQEAEVGIIAPIMAYPLIENAIGNDRGESVDEHLMLISRLWAGFSEVATRQPCAWAPEAHTAAEIAHAGPSNRLVTHPYRKLHNANIQVDQAAAVILCSVAHARAIGVPSERWVFLHASATATDEWNLSERNRLDRSPAIAACASALFEHARIGPADIQLIDLYSCFPAAVQLAAHELGLELGRQLTCTGGLTFYGGPGNNYATHGVIALARALREAPDDTLGLASALGWYATKHAIGVYGNTPPAAEFAAMEPAVAGPARREVAPPGSAYSATAETATVIYERDGSPSYGILFALLDDGRRVLGNTRETAVLEAVAQDGFLGAPVEVAADRGFEPG
jgi:acetyl-CoA C-acetyltransferase